ncbi:leukocyte immunoglobulin-like receptor subfamily A member 2 [Mauremys reevesii]|uniref:leukocyte immunoglobulin-like receptor subfamily A member 2 n=1 Tax=Mauremys reevesii TaxID=260615 RepID=UPI00193FCC0E|nr:leukocyte immunoglobulin-like receptor subfamily A member 2 [Mauremys reevesii]
MVSALTVLFLELPVPGPSISVSPSRVITVGGAVTIRCQCRCKARRLFLYKDGIQIGELDAGDRGEFTIPSTRHGDGGAYSCRSRSRSEPPNWSDPSDYVWIVIAELSSPKPSISLSPRGGVALGGTVTIRCECRCQKAKGLMYKLGNPDVLRWAVTAGDVVVFTIRNVSRRDTGSYSCQYGTKSDPPVWSHPSDPVELVVAGLGAGSVPSPIPAEARFNPTEGTNPAGPEQPDPPTTEPEGEELPAPRLLISVSPSRVIVPGAAVTIRCQCACEARRLFLYKDGIQIWELNAAADGGEFTIPSARRGDGGFYSCRFRSRSEPPNWLYPSDYVRIIVAEFSYPKPSISLRTSGGVALGGTVTIRCECRCQNATVIMYKLGNPDVQRWAVTAGGMAEFTIDNVSWRDTGSYSCQYGTKSDPPIWSHPSDPVELVVAVQPSLDGQRTRTSLCNLS